MSTGRNGFVFWLLMATSTATAQVPDVKPQVLIRPDIEGRVTAVEVAAHFVTAIRMPETVNSVVVGDPTLFQVEHSDREPQLVFVKALTTKPAETNLLISTTHGHEASLLLVSRGEHKSAAPASVDFLLKYKPAGGFLIEPDYPSALVAQTVPVTPGTQGTPPSAVTAATPVSLAKLDSPASPMADPPGEIKAGGLDELLRRQERAPLPALLGEHVAGETTTRERVRTGVSEVIDGGQQVIALFSVVHLMSLSLLRSASVHPMSFRSPLINAGPHV
jgi:hypothetical protein